MPGEELHGASVTPRGRSLAAAPDSSSSHYDTRCPWQPVTERSTREPLCREVQACLLLTPVLTDTGKGIC